MRRKSVHGFTLIELLVVVAIIALLIAILLPSLSKAKRRAVITQCGTNLHGIGRNNAAYESDFGVAIPNYQNFFPTTGFIQATMTPNNSNYSLRSLLLGVKPLTEPKGATGGYWGSPKLWICPAPSPTKMPYQVADEGGTTQRNYSNYLFFFGDPCQPGKWSPVPPATSPTTFLSARTPRDPADRVIATDFLWVNVRTDSYPAAGFGQANHLNVPSGQSEKCRIAASAQVTVESFTFDGARLYTDVMGSNTLYHDGHVSFVNVGDTTGIRYDGVISYYMDLPADLK